MILSFVATTLNYSFYLVSRLFLSLFFPQAKSIREFDERFTSRAFGYRDHVEYYNAASLHSAPLDNIAVPTVFLNSADDPFSPGSSKFCFFLPQ